MMYHTVKTITATIIEFMLPESFFKKSMFLLPFMLVLMGMAVAQENNVNQKDEDGLRQGRWVGHFSNGNLRYEGNFVDNEPVGVFKYYYPDGPLRAELKHLEEEENMVKATFYHKNRQIMAEGFFDNRKKQGLWRFFNRQGRLMAENYYHQDENHGVWKAYYPSGQLAEKVTWHYGEKEGPWKRFFESGIPRLITNHQNDKLSGDYELFYDNGNAALKAFHKENQPHQTWKYYSPAGELEKVIEYDMGKILDRTVYIERDEEETIPLYPEGYNPAEEMMDSPFGW